MKTEAIRQIIDEFLRLIYKGVVVYEDEPDNDWKDCASDARAELTAIHKENARKDVALDDARLSLGQSFESMGKRDLLAIIGEAERIIEAALSGEPSGKALVDRERIRNISRDAESLVDELTGDLANHAQAVCDSVCELLVPDHGYTERRCSSCGRMLSLDCPDCKRAWES